MKTKIVVCFILIFNALGGFAQIQIWLYDGTLIKTTGYRIDTNVIWYLNKSQKAKALSSHEVFAIIDKTDTMYFAVLDTSTKINQADYLDYLKGLHDGFSHDTKIIFATNFLLGASSAMILPLYGFSGGYIIVPNLISTFGFGASKVKKLPAQENNLYLQGYKLSAKKKKVISSVAGSVAGLAFGTAVLYLIKNK
jgi:hypothetical protein